MNGAIIVNKEKGYTSRDVVNKLNKILDTKKIGHTGTLDPLASGVLVCLIGKYTKLVPIITEEEKEYIAEIKLGIKTDTLDVTGNVLEKGNIPKLSKDEIISVLNSFIGVYKETVPLYSAVSVNGKRLYEYARSGLEVKLPEREVYIKEISLISYEFDLIKFKVLVSKGTYIRSLITSICEKLNTIGTMNNLVRIKQGQYKIQDSYTLEEIRNGNYQLLKLADLINLEKVEITDALAKKIVNGNLINLAKEGYILFTKNGEEKALYNFQNKQGKLVVLL